MSSTHIRPLPSLDELDTGPFWAATSGHELRYQRCIECVQVVFYPRKHCTNCGSSMLEWHVSAGEGVIYSFTVIRRNGHPYFSSIVPYVVALVDMDEGFRMMTNIVQTAPENVRIGQRVRVFWEDYDTVSLPMFVQLDAVDNSTNSESAEGSIGMKEGIA